MVDVKAGTTADDARRRSTEAVLRIREESRLRVSRQRHRACFSWCMVASLVGGISLAAMDAYDARQRELADRAAAEEMRLRHRAAAAAAEKARQTLAKEVCASRAVALYRIRQETEANVMGARTGKAKTLAFTAGMTRWNAGVGDLFGAGCKSWLPSPPSMTPRPRQEVERKENEICGGPRGSRRHSHSRPPDDGLL
jgi:hypothetical protein